LRMPVSVLPMLFVALFAAGVSTALPCEAAPCVAEVAAPILLPVVPWFSALLVLGPGEPPVPLMVCPLERVPPAAPPEPVVAVPLAAALPPLDPPAICAKASEEWPRSKLRIIVRCFTSCPLVNYCSMGWRVK
jgi:hypothetical protein